MTGVWTVAALEIGPEDEDVMYWSFNFPRRPTAGPPSLSDEWTGEGWRAP